MLTTDCAMFETSWLSCTLATDDVLSNGGWDAILQFRWKFGKSVRVFGTVLHGLSVAFQLGFDDLVLAQQELVERILRGRKVQTRDGITSLRSLIVESFIQRCPVTRGSFVFVKFDLLHLGRTRHFAFLDKGRTGRLASGLGFLPNMDRWSLLVWH